MALRRRSSSLMILLLISAGFSAGQEAPGCGPNRPLPPLPANAEQVAREIGILPLVRRVRTLASTSAPASGISIEGLSLRQQITEAVLATNLDVDDVIAKISYEQARVGEVQDRLSNAKNSNVNAHALIALIVGPGSNAVGAGMQFDTATAKAGNWVQVVGGTACVVLSALALRERGGTTDLGVAPNMLASMFGREPEVSSVYPQDVWTYLNTVPAANPRVQVPWKEELITEWVRAGRIGPPTVPASQAKIDRLTSGIANRKRLSIDDLNDRKAMLSDVRSRVSLMKRDLRDLTKAISIPAP